ncbi:MAG: carboxylate--amine ligase [Bacteroidetes bacterium]|nr:MAG: carboxylate--amine ligase [Bacteroidota bacterium]
MQKKQKKLLLLGGLRYLIPVIKAAHDLGLYVITCDYIPNNIAHKFSDEYHNVSIIDKSAVLKLAIDLGIDGIMSFAVDPGVLTAAYVAEKMGLPSCPYKSVKILQNKALFRKFLKDNNFNVPTAQGFYKQDISCEDLSKFNFPVIVKPVDSAGSKGVTKVNEVKDLKSAIKTAISNSISGQFIIEDFIEQKGYSSDTDCFSVDGKIVFYSFSNQRFDKNAVNPYTPSAFTWPSTISEKNQKELRAELQRLVKLLNLGTSIYNIEVREGVDDKAYIMEMSPRGGGNRLSEVLKHATGVDLIKNAVKAAVGDKSLDVSQKDYNGYWAQVIIHSNVNGYFQGIEIEKKINKYVEEIILFVEKGEKINSFSAANASLGSIILNFDTQEKMEKNMNEIDRWLKILVK